jgi:hypothetical protein
MPRLTEAEYATLEDEIIRNPPDVDTASPLRWPLTRARETSLMLDTNSPEMQNAVTNSSRGRGKA